MISRYQDNGIRAIFSDMNKYTTWLNIELANVAAISPPESADRIRSKLKITKKSLEQIAELELKTKHDVVAFIKWAERKIGKDSQYFHYGLTSSDIVDTANSLLINDALSLTIFKAEHVLEMLVSMMRHHKYTFMLARTHGQAAEPTTLGLKLLGWKNVLSYQIDLLKSFYSMPTQVRFLGSVGIAAHCSSSMVAADHIESKYHIRTTQSLGVGMQIIPREYFADIISRLSLMACSIERFATDIRIHAQTGIDEMFEGKSSGQVGSSSMPHKSNPIGCENICGMARMMRAYSHTMAENIAVWSERDISHSSSDRIVIEDSFHTICHILSKFTGILENLIVDDRHMLENIERSFDKVSSQYNMNILIDRGIGRTNAHLYCANNKSQVTMTEVLNVVSTRANAFIREDCHEDDDKQ